MSRHRTTGSPRESHDERADRSPAAVRTRNLAKDYGDGPVLLPLDLDVEPGERIALIGHNGSGKTTLLRMITGLLDVSSGSISVFGHAPGSLEARRHVSYLSDTPVFYDDLSVWEHLDYTARLHGVVEWEQDAADLLGQLGIYERADDLPSRFSRGLKQKAAIALALIRPFDVLLVDEPFVGLDATGRDALLALLDSAGERGATLLVATHEPSFLERVPRVVALRNGALMFDGAAQDESVKAWLHSPS
jgi:ABC-type multidrug transport system ATPase subunit